VVAEDSDGGFFSCVVRPGASYCEARDVGSEGGQFRVLQIA